MWIYILFCVVLYGAASLSKTKFARMGLLVLFVLFVGFRYETGTDWQVYKPNYIEISDYFGLFEFHQASVFYGQEPMYMFLNILFSKLGFGYEYFQAIMTIFFAVSTLGLAKKFGATNAPLVLAAASAYLWMNVEFSTVRQALAISFFNTAIIFYLDRRRVVCLLLMAAAVTSHYSSFLYLWIFLFAAYLPTRVARFAPLIFLSGALIVALVFSGALNNYLPSIMIPRLGLYGENRTFVIYDPVNFIYLAIFIFGLLTAFKGRRMDAVEDDRVRVLRNLVVLFALAGMAFMYFPIFRDRISYEFIILLSIYCSLSVRKFVKQSIGVVFSWGVLFSAYQIIFTDMLPYKPYQNYLVYRILGIESTSESRMQEFFERNYR